MDFTVIWKEKWQQHLQYLEEFWLDTGYKKVWNCPDDFVCESCKENKAIGRIKTFDKFPSWKLYPPFHKDCRCSVHYNIFNPEEA